GGSLGGVAPAALVHSICGLYHLANHGPAQYANDGFAREFAERLLAAGGALGPTRMGKVEVLPHHPGAFSEIAAAIARETPRLEVRLNTQVTAVTEAAHKLSLESGDRRSTVATATSIDASGDGVIAALIGAPFEQEDSERLQRPAFVFALAGLAQTALTDQRRFKIAGRIVEGVQRGDLPTGALGAGLRRGIHPGEAFVTIDLAGPEGYDPTDGATLMTLESEGRDLAFALASYLRTKVEGFEDSSICHLPSRIAVRESRRIVGRYRLETEDIERGARFDDAVALATWPIELRETNRGPRLRFPEGDRPCEIPLRCLRFRDYDHLFMAGRCLSCSHGAQASIRVIGTCLATGEAAGRAAALVAADRPCTAKNVRSLGAHSIP
ncbi:MAG: FAD-dependent oxidoreductase, partial [Chthoniobacteraceae bacterium]